MAIIFQHGCMVRVIHDNRAVWECCYKRRSEASASANRLASEVAADLPLERMSIAADIDPELHERRLDGVRRTFGLGPYDANLPNA